MPETTGNDADNAPSPNRFCIRFGILSAARRASAAIDVPSTCAITASRANPSTRLISVPAATRTAPELRGATGAGVDVSVAAMYQRQRILVAGLQHRIQQR